LNLPSRRKQLSHEGFRAAQLQQYSRYRNCLAKPA
jgi:hypothetical protein